MDMMNIHYNIIICIEIIYFFENAAQLWLTKHEFLVFLAYGSLKYIYNLLWTHK
jgi:hypothetical protein